MGDPRVDRLAKLLVGYSVGVKAGETVVVSSPLEALPLARAVYREVVRAGGHPFVNLGDEEMTEIFLEEANEEQLRYIHEPRRLIMERYDASIAFIAPSNTRHLSAVDAQKQSISRQASHPLMATMMQRTAEKSFRWTLTQFPTQASAQDGDMSLGRYEAFVYGACQVERDAPIAFWQETSARQQRLVEWLKGKDRVEIKGATIDMTLSIAGRAFINDDGHFNMPGGEIFTGPVEDSVNGWVRFTYPAIYGGREVEGVELRFENGRVEQATATKNQEYLLSVLDTDAGARFLGEWAIGTNFGIDRFTRNILFDEKIGGTLHMAVGAGYPETGSQNQSAVHWDMICDLRDGAEIRVDGELFYRNGEFVV